MIANETTLNKRPNDTEINYFRRTTAFTNEQSPYRILIDMYVVAPRTPPHHHPTNPSPFPPLLVLWCNNTTIKHIK